MANYKGEAYCTSTNLTGAVHFKLTTDSGGTFSGTRADRSTWELNAGASVTLYFYRGTTGTLPPALPDGDGGDLVRLRVYHETGTGTLVRELFTGTSPPANGTSYTFYATSNGLIGGSPRAGTLRLRIEAIQSGELLDNYNIDSDTQDQGVLRCNQVTPDTKLVHDGYPSGSTYAIGPASTESVGITFTHDPPFGTGAHQDMRIDVLDAGAVQFAGTQQDLVGTSSTLSVPVNTANFDDTSKAYGLRVTPIGAALLQPTSEGSMLWCRFGSGTGTTQNGNSVERASGVFNVDPRVTVPSPTLSKSLHNRGDSTTIDYNVRNARNENLTRSLNYVLKDSGGTTRKSGSDSGANYDIDYTIGSADAAAFDFVGSQWTFETSNSEFTTVTSNAYRVSRKVMIGSGVGSNNLSINTNFEVYNRGETVTYDFYVSAADGTAYTRTVTAEVHNTAHGVENQRSESNGDGHFQDSYVVASGDTATGDQTGSLKHIEIDPNGTGGNSADASAAEWGVSTLRVIHSTATLPSGNPANADNTVSIVTTTSDDGGGGDRSLLNVLETAQIDYYLYGVRGQAWPFSFNSRIIAADGSTDFTDVRTPSGAGLVSYTRTMANGVESAFDLVGDAKHIRADSSDSNDTVNSADAAAVSSKILIGSAAGLDDGDLVIEVGSVGSGDDATMSGVYPTAIFNRDSGEADVAISTYLSYARLTKYANQTVSSAVHSDVHGVEDSQTPTTDANGLLAYTYTIANTDKATAHVEKSTGGYSTLPTGSPKHLTITDGDNTTIDSDEAWGVTKHLWVDVHDEREEPLNRDTWNPADPSDGSENAEEEPFQYVILGDTLKVWAHVMSVRLDREIETWDGDTGSYPANRAVRLRTIKPSGSVNATMLTDTGIDGWTSGVDEAETGELNGATDPMVVEETYETFSSGTDQITLTGVDAVKGNRYIIFSSNGSAPVDITGITGMGFTWVQVDAQESTNNSGRLEAWISEGAFTGAENIVIDYSGVFQDCAVTLVRVSGGDVSEPVLDFTGDSQNGSSWSLPTLTGDTGTGIVVVGVNGNDKDTVTMSAPLAKESDNPGAGSETALGVGAFTAQADNSTSGSFSAPGSTRWQAIAVSLRAGDSDDPNSGLNFNRPWNQETGSMTPASSNWQVCAEVDFDGNSGRACDLITIASPLITSKARIFAPATVSPAETFKVYVEVLDKAIASGEVFATFQPATPEKPPELGGLVVEEDSPDYVDDSVIAREVDKNGESMKNVIDDTATVNGSLYYLEVTAPAIPGTVINWFAVVALGGDAFTNGQTRVTAPEFNPLGEIFA